MGIQSIVNKLYTKNIHQVKFIFLFFIFVILDQWLKGYIQSSSLLNAGSFLGIGLETLSNPHWAFGVKLKINFVYSSLLFASLLCLTFYVYLFFIFYQPISSLFKWAFTLLASGLTSNLMDRIQKGYVVDFISLDWFPAATFYLNTADVFQTIGWILLAYGIITNRKKIWKINEQRKTLIIMKDHQMNFVFYLLTTVLSVSTFFILIQYQITKHIEHIKNTSQDSLATTYFTNNIIVIFLLVVIVPVVVGLAIYFSNKIYGPIYAFKKYVYLLIEGKNPPPFKLRKNDQMKKELEKLAQDLAKKIQK